MKSWGLLLWILILLYDSKSVPMYERCDVELRDFLLHWEENGSLASHFTALMGLFQSGDVDAERYCTGCITCVRAVLVCRLNVSGGEGQAWFPPLLSVLIRCRLSFLFALCALQQWEVNFLQVFYVTQILTELCCEQNSVQVFFIYIPNLFFFWCWSLFFPSDLGNVLYLINFLL